MARYKQGFFKPRNPSKYRGDPTNIVYRSWWEFLCMKKFDEHPGILEWGSEEIIVKYRSPIDGKIHRYFPDFFIKTIDKNNNVNKILIEIKPDAQTKPPKTQTGKPSRKYLNEVKTWGINSAKWKAAENYCLENGWQFQILTEKHIGI